MRHCFNVSFLDPENVYRGEDTMHHLGGRPSASRNVAASFSSFLRLGEEQRDLPAKRASFPAISLATVAPRRGVPRVCSFSLPKLEEIKVSL